MALTAATAGIQARAQSCTTQSRMTAQQRAELGATAYSLAAAVQSGDAAKVRAGMVPQYAGDPNATAYLIRSTGETIAGDSLAVTQVYLLDASGRKAGDSSPADFSCTLTGATSETDFSIAGLPPGRFAFVMVEAQGAKPWLLAFLLQDGGGSWKMAGFYPHPRAAAGHEGLWYWTQARADAKADKPWLAWVMYSEADQLLRPAAFASSGNLDKLRAEQRTSAPQALTNGLGVETPMPLQGAGGTVFRVTQLEAQNSDDGKFLNLVMHIQGDSSAAGTAATDRDVQAAKALLTAHPELREGFTNVWVVADMPGGNPVVVQKPVSELVAGSK